MLAVEREGSRSRTLDCSIAIAIASGDRRRVSDQRVKAVAPPDQVWICGEVTEGAFYFVDTDVSMLQRPHSRIAA